jgi:hypothetical protein
MRRWLASLLILFVFIGAAACGGDDGESPAGGDPAAGEAAGDEASPADEATPDRDLGNACTLVSAETLASTFALPFEGPGEREDRPDGSSRCSFETPRHDGVAELFSVQVGTGAGALANWETDKAQPGTTPLDIGDEVMNRGTLASGLAAELTEPLRELPE